MGSAAAIDTPALWSLDLLTLPPQAWKVYATRMLPRALACYRDGEIDAETAMHYVFASSEGYQEADRLRLSAAKELATHHKGKKPYLGAKRPDYPTRLRIAIGEMVWVFVNKKDCDVKRASTITRALIERSGLLKKVPSVRAIESWHRAVRLIVEKHGSPLADRFGRVTVKEMREALRRVEKGLSV